MPELSSPAPLTGPSKSSSSALLAGGGGCRASLAYRRILSVEEAIVPRVLYYSSLALPPLLFARARGPLTPPPLLAVEEGR
uniref:Uncharacterized protein n=1 Tax=Leersia perrieri TaxID=77586 RepID=A0A0D9WF94_9ORYZ